MKFSMQGSLSFILSMVVVASFAQQDDFKLIENVRIKMKDGTVLAGHLSYPANGDRVPVLFRFNCYARPNDLKNTAKIFQFAANLGYAYAEVYTRGSGKSEGDREPFVHDVDDVHEVIDWLSKQSWCNGEVAMGGGSYLGYTQWAAMKRLHPALKTIVPMVATAPGKDLPYLNGILANHMIRWLSLFDGPYCNDSSYDDSNRWRKIYNQAYTSGTPFYKLDSLLRRNRDTVKDWLDHPTFDEYWSSKLPSSDAEFKQIDIPILTIAGYFDSDQRGSMYYYNAHQRNNKENEHYLLIGPYDHMTGQNQKHLSRYHYYRFDSSAYVNKFGLGVKWYNHILKHGPMPEEIKDKVNVYVIGDGWRYGSSLKGLAPDTMMFYMKQNALRRNRQLKGIAVLPFDSRTVVDSLAPDYTYRTAILFNHTEEFLLPVEGNENYLRQTPLLVFDSPPLEADFDLVGSPVSEVYLALSGIRDADIELQYYEVTNEGKSYPLSIAVQRLSLIDDTRRTLPRDGVVSKYRLDNAYFMGKRLTKGSFVRVTIRVINEAGLQKNYGSGKAVGKETLSDGRTGKLVIHFGASHDSAIRLPGQYVKD